MKRSLMLGLAALVGGALLAVPSSAQAQRQVEIEVPQEILDLRFPNGAGKAISAPTGWGAAYQSAFVGAGYQDPVAFTDEDDGSISAGIGLWDPVLAVGIQGNLAMNDVSEGDDFTFGAKLHRYLGKGTALAVGAETLFESFEGADPDPSFFAVVSHTLQGMDGVAPGTGRVHLNLGVGNERFGEKSSRAQNQGKGENGTYVFGGVAVEVLQNLNLIGEWDGIGLNLGGAYTAPIPRLPLSVTVAVADLTKEATDDPRLVVSGGIGFSIFY